LDLRLACGAILNTPLVLSERIIERIVESLPEPVCERRRELLPQILHEWNRTDLQKHLSMDSRATIQARIGRIEQIRKCARELLQVLNAVDENERNVIVHEMLMRRSSLEVRRSRFLNNRASRVAFTNLKRRLDEESDFLAKLAEIAPEEVWKLGRGQPRNLAAHFVLRDAAAIFAWFTGRKPARGVHPIDNSESGPFFRFASSLWPVVFEKGTWGLPAAMRRWGGDGSWPSALIANIDLRHPTWGIFEC
jgi:acetolactate synthase small subunit